MVALLGGVGLDTWRMTLLGDVGWFSWMKILLGGVWLEYLDDGITG